MIENIILSMGDNNFIREEIKDKPVNKKKIAEKVGVAALCGLVFAIVASVVIALCEPRLAAFFGKDDQKSSEQTLPQETESESETEEDIVPEVSVDYTISIEDYQAIQTELYRIGMSGNKAIVTVTGVSSNVDWLNNAFESSSQGSGLILSMENDQVLILTERRLLASAEKILVSFIDDTSAEAKLLGYDSTTGLAVISVAMSEIGDNTKFRISSATLGNSDLVSNGQMVIALGSPLGVNYSVLVGNITSSKNMTTTEDYNYAIYTTDIVANSKGSGVLINTKGEVIGMAIQNFGQYDGSNTLTAVPVNEIKEVISYISQGKQIPYVGVVMSDVTDKMASQFGLPKGAFVATVTVDSPAMLGGIQPGDVIVSFNNKAVVTSSDFSASLLKCNNGEVVTLSVKRQNGNEYIDLKLDVTIGVK